jgi:hypothetical protein
MLAFYLTFAFIASTLATMHVTDPKTNLKQNLANLLTPKERQHYQDIITMRRNIYFQGLVFGILVALFVIFIAPKIMPIKMKKSTNLFTAISITFVVNYFYYILYPKDKYMIELLDTKEENKAWLEIYKTMQFRYHLGFLFGLVAAGCVHALYIYR